MTQEGRLHQRVILSECDAQSKSEQREDRIVHRTIRDLQKTERQVPFVDPQNASVLTLQNQRFVADFVKFDFENISPKCFLRSG